ncbi:RNA ligase (ATP) [Candidatus Saganbacteria bacterium]|nr:RNA ligase (ATP) [Candidatus Saganbacteria bacterium]
MTERKLASIQKIIKLEPIAGADLIETATVLGWQCVVKKNEFHEGDKIIYCEIDSFLPLKPEFEFLRKSSYKKLINGQEGFRLKTMKFKGVLSQGLALPISVLPADDYEEGADVAAILGIEKYDPPIPVNLQGIAKGVFPRFIPKSDELRAQSYPEALNELKGQPYYITTKADGTSATFYLGIDLKFGVCSRNLELVGDENNTYWRVARKYGLEKLLKDWQATEEKCFAIQAELVGPWIQKNPLALKESEIRVFSIYNISDRRYVDFDALLKLCAGANPPLPVVDVEEKGENFNYTLEDLIEKAKGTYASGRQKEGIVIRPQTERWSDALQGRLSFKVLNNNYLLKEE